MENKLLKKLTSFSYGNLIGMFIGLLTTAVSTRFINPEEFGKATVFTLAVNILSIIIFMGNDQAFVRFFYEEKEELRGGLLYNCLKIPMLMLLLVSFLILIFQDKISFYIFEEINTDAVYLLIFGLLINIFYKFAISLLRMLQLAHLYSMLEILNRIMAFIFLIVSFKYIGVGYASLIYSSIMAMVLVLGIILVAKRDYWKIKYIKIRGLKHTKNEIFNYGFPLVFTLLITFFFQSFDKFLLKRWVSYEQLGIYMSAFKVVSILNVIQTGFTSFWVPVSFEQFEKNPNDTVFFSKAFDYISFFMLIVSFLCIMAKGVIVLLLGNSYQDSAEIMPFLIFMPVMFTISETTVVGINFFKKSKEHIKIAGISCVLNIVLNIVLISKLGVKGAAIATATSYIVFFWLRTKISNRYFDVEFNLKRLNISIAILYAYCLFSTFFKSVFLNTIIGIISFSLVSILYKNLWQVITKKMYTKDFFIK